MSGWQKHPSSVAASSRTALSVVPRLLRITSWILLVISLLFAALTAWLLLDTRAFLARAVRTEGTVVRLVELRDSDGRGVTYAPVFQVNGIGGRSVEVSSSTSANPPAWRVGQTVALLQDPAEPTRVQPEGWFSAWLFPLVSGGFALMGLAGVALLRFGASRMAADMEPR